MDLERKNGHKTGGGIMLFSDMNGSAFKRGGGGFGGTLNWRPGSEYHELALPTFQPDPTVHNRGPQLTHKYGGQTIFWYHSLERTTDALT